MKIKDLFEARNSKFSDPSLIKNEDDMLDWFVSIESICQNPQMANIKAESNFGSMNFTIDQIHFANFKNFFNAMEGFGYKAKGDPYDKYTEDYKEANTVLTKGKSKITLRNTFSDMLVQVKK